MAEFIEREAAIAYAPLPKYLREYQTMNLDDAWDNGYDFAIRQIESIPTADVRPVVHGHDTGNARIFECSECGYGFSDIFLTNERDYPIDPNFCPNCGADMRKLPKEE